MRPDYGPHFLIATDAEAAIGAESIELDGFNAFAAWDNEVHGLGPENLAELHCVVTERAADYSVLDNYHIVYTRDEMHGPWLVRMPEEFVAALASLDGQRLTSLGEDWVKASDGFQFRQAPTDWVQRVGFQLVELAKRAVRENNGLYCEFPSC